MRAPVLAAPPDAAAEAAAVPEAGAEPKLNPEGAELDAGADPADAAAPEPVKPVNSSIELNSSNTAASNKLGMGARRDAGSKVQHSMVYGTIQQSQHLVCYGAGGS